MKILWTEEALARLRDIKKYIAQNNPDRARLFIQKIIDQTDILTSNPRIGRVVPEITRPDIRELLFKNYRIIYRFKKDNIEILTVFEGHSLLNTMELSD
jgi:addiction module RelE/StbE family toxin